MNEIRERILNFLRNNNLYLSGQFISRELGLSRSAVWKHIKYLRSLGYKIESGTHRGYYLTAVPDIPYPWEITPHLRTAILGREIEYYDCLTSTNTTAAKAAEKQKPEGYCVIADRQTGGRGRLHRPWFSPAGKNLYMSLLLKPKIAPAAISELSLVAALALLRTVRKWLKEDEILIKWPNDLYINRRKVAGILCESSSESDQVHYAIIGIGVNLNLTEKDLPPELGESAGSLRITNRKKINRPIFAAELLNCLESIYGEWSREGLKTFIPELEAASLLIGREITVSSSRRLIKGKVLGLDTGGRLRVRNHENHQEEIISCGDITSF